MIKMPRGAIPTPRSELAASDPYRPESSAEVFVPSGALPTPNHELASAQPYRPSGAAPESFLAWPIEIGFWGNEKASNSIWAEEAFAKACAEPKVFIPADVVLLTAQECGSSNFARFMQTHGFQMDRMAYLDGPFNKIDWTNTAALNGAIANVGAVKIGVATASLTSSPQGQVTHSQVTPNQVTPNQVTPNQVTPNQVTPNQVTPNQVTPGTSGWAIYGLPTGQPGNHCASLCGYGPLAALASLFERYGVNVNVPSGMPAELCYAMFTWGSIGIVDHQSLMNITGEAWVRNPTTIVRNLDK
jgi:hypothetical protein